MEIGSFTNATATLQNNQRERAQATSRADRNDDNPPSALASNASTGTDSSQTSLLANSAETTGLAPAQQVAAAQNGQTLAASENSTQATGIERDQSARADSEAPPPIYDQNGRNQRPPDEAFISVTV